MRSTKQMAYSELPPKVAGVLGAWLAEALGVVDIHLAKLEQADGKRDEEKRLELYEGL